MSEVIACNAAYGAGGLGQHFAVVVETARGTGRPWLYYSTCPSRADLAVGVGNKVSDLPFRLLAKYTVARLRPGQLNHLSGDLFDRSVAHQIRGRIETYTGFGGQSLHSFAAARRLGASELVLVAANSHVENVAAQHRKAVVAYPIEGTWLNDTQVRKTLREYEMADTILVASEYTRQSFLTRGVPDRKLRRIDYPVDPRFRRNAATRPTDGVFRIVCVGSLWVTKGIPVLIEAFAKLPVKYAELTLVGGWGTRGMRRYLQAAMGRDLRIKVSPGDPLPHLHRADVCVHPSYEDGFAYAPMEAMAAGVPVIVTEDTGMKEHVREGENGWIVPTGDVEAIVQRLEWLAKRR